MQKIQTSNPTWVAELAKCYKGKTPAVLVDDANLGIDPASETIRVMGGRADLGVQGWVAVVVALGVAAAGAYLLVMAILDPEPFSKIGFALGAGVVLTMGGGWTAIRVLTNTKPPNVIVGPAGSFEINWD